MPSSLFAVVTTVIIPVGRGRHVSSARGRERPGAESLRAGGLFLCFQCKPSSGLYTLFGEIHTAGTATKENAEKLRHQGETTDVTFSVTRGPAVRLHYLSFPGVFTCGYP